MSREMPRLSAEPATRLSDAVSPGTTAAVAGHDPEPRMQTRDQRSASAQRTYRWRQSPQCDFAVKVFQVCDGGFEGRPIYFETVDWATSKSSIRGHGSGMRPTVGFPCSSAGS